MKNDKKTATTEDAEKPTDSTEKNSVKTVVARIEELENQLKRALADYQNLEKRVQEEKKEWIRSANKELILRILPILDTLIIASLHSQDESLKVSVKQFEDVLKGEGIAKIETVGLEFNSQMMECVATEEGEENKVLEEVRSGYMLNDKVLRVAQVKVGKKEESIK